MLQVAPLARREDRREVVGSPDDLVLASIMMLFCEVVGSSSPFEQVLAEYSDGRRRADVCSTRIGHVRAV
ncbi:DUF1810 family protein [Acidovorax sp. Root217]|uniref:DUF1810 family protein n=1 Tax=Acidovorax sp. Root217 TaxID=1736492 RepID=UPI00138EEDFD